MSMNGIIDLPYLYTSTYKECTGKMSHQILEMSQLPPQIWHDSA